MKKEISWQVLIAIGLVGIFTGRFVGDVIGSAIGVVGDICLLIGIANGIVAFVKNRKLQKVRGDDFFEKKIAIDPNSRLEEKKYINHEKLFTKYAPFFVIVFLVISILYLVGKNDRSSDSSGVSVNESKKSDSLNDDGVSVGNGSSDAIGKKDAWDSVSVVTNYGAEVLQIGGVGSGITQKTAYSLTEQGYLKPSEDWVLSSFNSPADIMDVDCRSGYVITSCRVNGSEVKIDDIFGCRAMPLKNAMQNKVEIQCLKSR